MPAFTAQALIDRAAAIADTHDSFVTTNQWLAWLNTEIRALDIFMARAGWVMPTASVSTDTSEPYAFTLTGEILAVVGVWEERNGRYREVLPSHPVEFRHQNPTTGLITGQALRYNVERVADSDSLTVTLFPRPTGNATYVCQYLPVSTLVTSVSTSVYYPLGFEERLVLSMARKALVKEESDTGGVEKLLGETDQRIEEACWSRLLAQAPSIRNIDRATRGWTEYPDRGDPMGWTWI